MPSLSCRSRWAIHLCHLNWLPVKHTVVMAIRATAMIATSRRVRATVPCHRPTRNATSLPAKKNLQLHTMMGVLSSLELTHDSLFSHGLFSLEWRYAVVDKDTSLPMQSLDLRNETCLAHRAPGRT
ncbi:hypothetical protein VTI74DRAFT_11566 [Chaetomium olivicolor]